MASTEVGSIHYDLDIDRKNFDTSVKKISASLSTLGGAFGKLGGAVAEASRQAATIVGVGLTASVAGLTAVLSSSSQEAKEFEKAMISLDIIAERFNQSGEKAQQTAKDLGRELRIGTGAAADSLQNLIKTGLTLDQSADLLKRFTNEAITGKSASISLSQAVQNLSFAYATGNSALGNLSGVSENFSDITDRGAELLKKEGVAVEKITDDMAKYRGMIELTNMTKGASERFTGTLIDTEAQLNGRLTELKVTIGQQLNPIINQFYQYLLSLLPSTEALAEKIKWMSQAVVGFFSIFKTDDILDFSYAMEKLGASDETINRFWEFSQILKQFGEWVIANKEIVLDFFKGMVIAFGALAAIGIVASIANPLVLITTTLGLLVAAWENNLGGIQKTIEVFNFLKDIFERFILPDLKELWKVIQTQLIPAFKSWWTAIQPLMPALQALAALFGVGLVLMIKQTIQFLTAFITILSAVVTAVSTVVTKVHGHFKWLYDTLVGNSIIPDLVNGIISWFKRIPSMISSALSGLYNSIVSPFKSAFNEISKKADETWQKLQKINPFHRNSPSLVDNVKKGMGIIEKEVNALNFNVPSIKGAFNSEDVKEAQTTQQTVHINIEKVNDMQDVQMMGRELGFRMGITPGIVT